MRQATLKELRFKKAVCIWNETYHRFEKDRAVVGMVNEDKVVISVPPYTPDATEIVKLENVYIRDEVDDAITATAVAADEVKKGDPLYYAEEENTYVETREPMYKEVKSHCLFNSLAGHRVDSVVIDEEANHVKIFFDGMDGKVLHIKPDLNVGHNKNVWLGIKTYITEKKIIGYKDCD
jgi:hypothetical protein